MIVPGTTTPEKNVNKARLNRIAKRLILFIPNSIFYLYKMCSNNKATLQLPIVYYTANIFTKSDNRQSTLGTLTLVVDEFFFFYGTVVRQEK